MVGWDLQTASRRTGKPSLSVPWSASPGRRLAVLAADGLLQEGVWSRLEGLAGGMLAGVLLNEPDADCPVHEGDFMALAPTRAEDGSPMLLTVPDLLISHPEG